MPNYLLPAGRSGFIYGPEIIDVLKKYQKLKVDINDDDVLQLIATDITKAIQALPLNCIEVEEEPAESIPQLLGKK